MVRHCAVWVQVVTAPGVALLPGVRDRTRGLVSSVTSTTMTSPPPIRPRCGPVDVSTVAL